MVHENTPIENAREYIMDAIDESYNDFAEKLCDVLEYNTDGEVDSNQFSKWLTFWQIASKKNGFKLLLDQQDDEFLADTEPLLLAMALEVYENDIAKVMKHIFQQDRPMDWTTLFSRN